MQCPLSLAFDSTGCLILLFESATSNNCHNRKIKMPVDSQSPGNVAMTCKVRGVLKTGDRVAGIPKKRVHFFDDPRSWNSDSQTVGESNPVVAETQKKGCQLAGDSRSLDGELEKVTIACDVSIQSTQKSMMESENDLQIVASLSNSSKFANGTDFGFAISFDDQSPVSTPPPCAEYDSENTLGSPHSQLVHAKGPQRKLIYPVGASEQHQFKRIGMANKRIPSRLQNVKVVPEGEDGSISMDFLEFPDFNPPTISRGFLTEDYPKKRCAWITLRTDPLYVAFHDEEWGVPVYDDRKLFELLVFAGAQSEISWSALLVKREALREFFAQFDPAVLAEYDGAMVASLRSDSDIMRSATRVESIISNAKLVMQIVEEHGSLGAYMWGFVGGRPILSRHKHGKLIPARTAKSEAISKDLQRRGFRHAGPIAVYSFMQAAGLANDHLLSCFRHPSCSDIVTPPVAAVRTAQIQLRRPSSPSSPAARKSLLLGSPRCFAMYS